MTEPETPAAPEKCASCAGTGEVYTDNGFDCCSECGGSGAASPSATEPAALTLLLEKVTDSGFVLPFYDDDGSDALNVEAYASAVLSEAAALAARPACAVCGTTDYAEAACFACYLEAER